MFKLCMQARYRAQFINQDIFNRLLPLPKTIRTVSHQNVPPKDEDTVSLDHDGLQADLCLMSRKLRADKVWDDPKFGMII